MLNSLCYDWLLFPLSLCAVVTLFDFLSVVSIAMALAMLRPWPSPSICRATRCCEGSSGLQCGMQSTLSPTLTCFCRLNCNVICDEGGVALAKSLRANTSLLELKYGPLTIVVLSSIVVFIFFCFPIPTWIHADAILLTSISQLVRHSCLARHVLGVRRDAAHKQNAECAGVRSLMFQ